jgi:hypothetical protein
MILAAGAIAALIASGPTPGPAEFECVVASRLGGTQIDRARAACMQARNRIAALFGQPAARVVLRFVDTPPRAQFEVRRDTVIAFVPTGKGGRMEYGSFDQWAATAAHEIAHNLFAARSGTPHRYGPDRGDWFMEAVAIWAEADADRDRRMRQLWADGRNRLPLREVLRMHHPNYAAGPRPARIERLIMDICRVPCPGRPDTVVVRQTILADGTERVDTLAATTPHIDQQALVVAFYGIAYSVLAFIHDRGGAAAVRLVEERIRAGNARDAVLGVGDLPATFAAFEAEWSKWLELAATPPREGQ